MSTTTAKVKEVTATAHGMTEQVARQFFDAKGKKGMAIIEFRSTKTHESLDGKDQVDLEVLSFEIVDQLADEHVRGLQRAMAMNRRLHAEDYQPTLDNADDAEPKVEDVMAKGIAFTPHDFHSAGRDDQGEWLDECDICGNAYDAPLHAEDQGSANLFQEPTDPADAEDQDEAEPYLTDDADADEFEEASA